MPSYGSVETKVTLKTENDLAPLQSFFFEAPEERYPLIAAAVLRGEGCHFDYAGVTFPGDLDPEDDSIAEGWVELYNPFTTVQISEVLFLQVLLDVVQACLLMYKESTVAPPEWEKRLSKAISTLESEISSRLTV